MKASSPASSEFKKTSFPSLTTFGRLVSFNPKKFFRFLALDSCLLLYPRLRIATFLFFLINSFANLSTTGVFPVPPTVRFPTTTTMQSRDLLRRIIRFEYKKSLTRTIPEKTTEKGRRNNPNNLAETERSRSYKTPSTKFSKSLHFLCTQLLFSLTTTTLVMNLTSLSIRFGVMSSYLNLWYEKSSHTS